MKLSITGFAYQGLTTVAQANVHVQTGNTSQVTLTLTFAGFGQPQPRLGQPGHAHVRPQWSHLVRPVGDHRRLVVLLPVDVHRRAGVDQPGRAGRRPVLRRRDHPAVLTLLEVP
jgi:hypothetical protein